MRITASVLIAGSFLAVPSFLAGGGGAMAADAPNVVASIKPIHSLVASVMQGVGEPMLIVDGAGSPHTYSMKPSNAAELEAADIVFWAGDDLEAFLVKPIETLGAKATSVELVTADGLQRLPYREGGAFEAHEDNGEDGSDVASHEHAAEAVAGHGAGEAAHDGDDHDAEDHAGAASATHEEHGHEHGHGADDMHFWLDPVNAKAMAATIEKTLSTVDPANAATYAANAAKLGERLDALVETTSAALAGVKDRPFIVFHDAYQYYERRFGVTAAGSITVSPENIPGVQRIAEIQAKVRDLGATCVFAEPQFEPRLVDVVVEGTKARKGVLDPEGAALADGPDLYFELIEGLTASLKDCLSQPS